jgi:hypothetical protein
LITDIRPLVERLLRKLVLAGLPLVTACGVHDPLGTGGTPSVPGTGGAGGGSGGVGAGGLGAGGAGTGTGGANGCVPLSLTCGFRSSCPPAPGSDSGSGLGLPLTMRKGTFEPDDPRLSELYRACLTTHDRCGPDCLGFCFGAAGLSTSTFGPYFTCDVTCGASNEVEISYESAVCGRRPAGHLRRRGCNSARPRAESALGRLLAEAAELEAASVPAFAQVAADLTAYGAPEALVQAARGAMADEARHWRRTRDAARRKGGAPVRPSLAARPAVSSLEALALDNVIEGCVRETFGALVAAHQAATAGDSDVATLMADIAEDEMEHAALAWRIDAWLAERLGDSFRASREVAARGALRELVAGATHPVDAELRAAAGLPTPAEATALLAGMWEALWKPAFGAPAPA